MADAGAKVRPLSLFADSSRDPRVRTSTLPNVQIMSDATPTPNPDPVVRTPQVLKTSLVSPTSSPVQWSRVQPDGSKSAKLHESNSPVRPSASPGVQPSPRRLPESPAH